MLAQAMPTCLVPAAPLPPTAASQLGLRLPKELDPHRTGHLKQRELPGQHLWGCFKAGTLDFSFFNYENISFAITHEVFI